MTLTESLVSSFILVALATQSGRLFGDSMQALGKSRLRDRVNAVIHQDIEEVRDRVALWKIDNSMTINGQLAYIPDEIHCEEGTLATALLNDNTQELPATTTVMQFEGLTVERNVSTATGNTNLIQVNYFTSGSNRIKTEISTTLSIPAQGWCAT